LDSPFSDDDDNDAVFVLFVGFAQRTVKKEMQKSQCCFNPHGDRRMVPPSLDLLFAAHIEG